MLSGVQAVSLHWMAVFALCDAVSNIGEKMKVIEGDTSKNTPGKRTRLSKCKLPRRTILGAVIRSRCENKTRTLIVIKTTTFKNNGFGADSNGID